MLVCCVKFGFGLLFWFAGLLFYGYCADWLMSPGVFVACVLGCCLVLLDEFLGWLGGVYLVCWDGCCWF